MKAAIISKKGSTLIIKPLPPLSNITNFMGIEGVAPSKIELQSTDGRVIKTYVAVG